MMSPVILIVQQLAVGVRLRARDDRGAGYVEYAFLLTLIAVVCLMAVTALGSANSASAADSASSIINAGR